MNCRDTIAKVLEKNGYIIEKKSRLKIVAYLGKKPEIIKNMEYKYDYDIHAVNSKTGIRFFIEIREGGIPNNKAENALKFFKETAFSEVYHIDQMDIMNLETEEEVEKFLVKEKILYKYGN